MGSSCRANCGLDCHRSTRLSFAVGRGHRHCCADTRKNLTLVQSALQNLMTGRTVIVIAHRLSTVRRADRIVVLENGTIAEVGKHEELMQKAGIYRKLYDLQFIDGDARAIAQLTHGAGTY